MAPGAFDSTAFRRALGHFATGVVVITAPGLAESDKPIGITVNSFTAISLDPPLVLFSAARSLRSLPALMAAQHFGINLLHHQQRHVSSRFADARSSKWDGIGFEPGETLGCPLLRDTLAHFECLPHATFDGGDHVIFLVRVERFWTSTTADAPLIFFRGDYRNLEQIFPATAGNWT
jgi:flavin reductase (DIM6/NTAB) family NADH-FMN oxidoreductase RutF